MPGETHGPRPAPGYWLYGHRNIMGLGELRILPAVAVLDPPYPFPSLRGALFATKQSRILGREDQDYFVVLLLACEI